MESDGIEFKVCPCGAEPEVSMFKTAAGGAVVMVSCPACGMSNSAMYGEGGPSREEAMAMLAGSWNSR